MNINNLKEMEDKVGKARYLIEKIEIKDRILNTLKGTAQSIWIYRSGDASTLVRIEKDRYDDGICSAEESKELSDIITGYLINIVQREKKELEEKLKNI
jgi:hypothetical protein